MKKTGRFAQTILAMLFIGPQLTGCGQQAPFEYNYTSKDSVEIIYQGKTYNISRSAAPQELPFTYAFEADGDLNVVVEGETYEIESPYDLDLSGKKKTAKKKVKKSKSRR
ncbi:MAG: hypothetical protein C4531_10595 [Desulfurivibrio sp.]|jgi:hypothetical protein|nr:MAG: hypothetical protein C4531_10595 [Desulfurivibrio sp.]